MNTRTVIRWYWAGAPWNRAYKAEVIESTVALGGANLYDTKADAEAAHAAGTDRVSA